jgi:valyl-tRNA synthetase
MSKSLGNSPDPLDLIEQYGADGVRFGMLLCSPAGNDILFDEKLVEQGRNFSNKLWNALRLVKGWEVKEGENAENKIIIDWMETKLQVVIAELENSYSDFRLSEVLMTVYKFIWDDFCSWYLELVKPDYQQPIDAYTYNKT